MEYHHSKHYLNSSIIRQSQIRKIHYQLLSFPFHCKKIKINIHKFVKKNKDNDVLFIIYELQL